MTRPPDPRPGDPITADHVRYLYSLADLRPELVPPLYWAEDDAIAIATRPGWWAKIAGVPGGASGKGYPWKEQLAGPGGTWIEGPRRGTATDDPAFELNGSTATITDKVVRCWRDEASFEVRFAFGACS